MAARFIMRATNRGGTRLRVARLATAVALVVSIVGLGTTVSLARPSHADLGVAKQKLATLNQQMSALVEQYDQAQVKLQQTEAELTKAQAEMRQAQAAMASAKAELSAQAAQAYESQGSALSVVLGASSFSELSDRVQFLQTIAQQNVDAATTAEVAREQARRASERLSAASKEKQALVDQLASKQNQIQQGISQTQGLIHTIQKSLDSQAAQAAINNPGGTGGVGPPPGSGGPIPPNAGAATAVAAARSALGVPYVYGGASMKGFDCSGLTMWSWAHAGVYLPHSAAMQYSVTRRVSTSDLQPGDLLFFYSPISHVAMYIGGGQEIAASHTGTVVSVYPVDWGDFVGAGRP